MTTDVAVQLPELRLEHEEQARALARHRSLLRRFLRPQSPAEVDMPQGNAKKRKGPGKQGLSVAGRGDKI